MGKWQAVGAWAIGAWAVAPAPAWAEVVDLPDLLPPAREEALQQSLQRLGRHQADVVFVQGEGSDLVALAKAKFEARGLGDRDLLIAIDPALKKVGVHLGAGFQERGVGSQAIQALLQRHFYPLARQGRFDEGAAAFAQATIQAAGQSPARGGLPGRRAEGSRGGFPWGTVLVVAALGGATWFVLKTVRGGGKGPEAEAKVRAMEQAHARIVGLALRLDEVGTLARFAPSEKQGAYRRLEQQAEAWLPEAKAMGDAVAEARAALQAKRPEQALQALAPWEGARASRLEGEIATALTALDGLEKEGLASAKALGLGEEAGPLLDRLAALKVRHAQACARAPQGYQEDAEADQELAQAQRLLTTPPVELARAQQSLGRAERAIEAHTREVKQALEREASRQDHSLGGGYGFASLPIFVPVPSYGFGWGLGYSEHHTTIVHEVGAAPSGLDSWGDGPAALGDSGGGTWGEASEASSSGGSWSDMLGGWGGGGDAGGSWGGDSGGGDWGGDSGGGGGDW